MVQFVTLLVFILGVAAVQMTAIRRLCVTALVQPQGSASAAGAENHCSATVAIVQSLGGATDKFLKGPIAWQSPATECPVKCRKAASLCIVH